MEPKPEEHHHPDGTVHEDPHEQRKGGETHSHEHVHPDGTKHEHEHDHTMEHDHVHHDRAGG